MYAAQLPQYNGPRQFQTIRACRCSPARGETAARQQAIAHSYEHSLHIPIPVAFPAIPSPLLLYPAVPPRQYGPQRFSDFPGAIPCIPKRKSIR
ncbi:hypothetical protein CO2235_230019 [Cupriavidus oxalaticus]|uniref:Uncharacterized protein n=1 Tax=Cupriavidus oxalaticus TaxID=96344 RepID=A0A976BD73_9BURK|nr:hypothetical protein CO2235_230019 [Cupriavidus oxalaticus]